MAHFVAHDGLQQLLVQSKIIRLLRWAHLRQAESSTEYPCDQQHQPDSAWSLVLTDGINDRHAPVNANDDNDVRRQVQAEHLQSIQNNIPGH